MSNKNSKSRREERAKNAQASNEAWRKLTPKQQFKALDDRLGKDQGAKKQRARLAALIESKVKKARTEKDAAEKKAKDAENKKRRTQAG